MKCDNILTIYTKLMEKKAVQNYWQFKKTHQDKTHVHIVIAHFYITLDQNNTDTIDNIYYILPVVVVCIIIIYSFNIMILHKKN